ERRKSIKRNHTATHLLHAALKEVLGDHIKQAGSLVSPERLRFDFTHFFAMKEREMDAVESIVNKKIIENMPVSVSETSLDDAVEQGVVALFGEKYGERVRVVRSGDFSAELCGGTHCHATGDIGPFKIVSEGSVASGIRRIEAVTGFEALEFHKARELELKKTAGMLKVSELKISDKVGKILQDLKTSEKELEKIKQKSVKGDVDSVLEKARDIDNIKVLAHKAEGLDMKALRGLADSLKDKLGSGVIVLGSVCNGQAFYVSAVTKDLLSRFHAGDILKKVTGGKGGGRPDMAQGGTKDTGGLDRALSSVYDMVQKN
ncbi:MAG: alanine--tRNA ligase, partial [Nitrospiraceae bacterium]